jgi:hypothetical protein
MFWMLPSNSSQLGHVNVGKDKACTPGSDISGGIWVARPEQRRAW